MKQKFFKISALAGITIFMSLFLLPSTVFSANQCPPTLDDYQGDNVRNVKVYLSETLSGGCEVFHVTRCEKISMRASLKCTKANADSYSGQCKSSNGAVKEETLIYECRHKDTEAVIGGKTEQQCIDDGNLWRPKVGYVYAGWKCPTREEDAPASVLCDRVHPEFGVKKATVVVAFESVALATLELAQISELRDSSDQIFVGPLYAIGADPQSGAPACLTGDYAVGEGGQLGDFIYGDLGGVSGDTKTKLGPDCKSVNNSDLSPLALIACTRSQIILSSSGTGLLSEFIGALFKWAASIVGIIAVLVMVVSGIQISMAGGDSAKLDSAKTRIMESISGLVILFLAWLILYTINPNFFQ